MTCLCSAALRKSFKPSPEDTCPWCAIKHVETARAKADQAKRGHPDERWHAVGELACAAQHTWGFDADIAESIRTAYNNLTMNWDTGYIPPFDSLRDRILAKIAAVEQAAAGPRPPVPPLSEQEPPERITPTPTPAP